MKYQAFKQKIKLLPLFSSSMLSSLTPNDTTLRVQLSMWKKKGLISTLRKGLYTLGRKERETEPSHFYVLRNRDSCRVLSSVLVYVIV